MTGNGEPLEQGRWTGEKPRRSRPAVFDAHRVPPHSVEAEQGLLGSMMQDREALSECVNHLMSAHLFIPTHQTIFAALCELYRDEKAVDLITLTQFLRDKNTLDTVGGAAYVTSLFTFVPTAANVQYYLEIVREKYLARQIIAKCTELVRAAYDDQSDIGDVLEQTQAALTEIIIDSERPDIFRHVREGVSVAIGKLEQAHRHRGQAAINGLATGINDFDRMTSGLRGQQLIIFGARPSHGKTALAMNCAANMAVKNKVPVGVFSMEMSFQEIVDRLLCSVSGVSLQRFRDGFLSDADFKKVPIHGGTIGEAPLWIDETPALSISSFKARARLMKVRLGVKVIIVDYLQLMRSPTKRSQEARWLEITEISGTLKAVAKELNIPLICCSQLNREVEQREFGKPRLSDLRESGSIEQDADIVALLWRPERHIQNPETENRKVARMLGLRDDDDADLSREEKALTHEQITERNRQIKQYAALIVAKQRNGPVNAEGVRLRFIADLTRFENVTEKLVNP
jgi:replicative DNA helicase